MLTKSVSFLTIISVLLLSGCIFRERPNLKKISDLLPEEHSIVHNSLQRLDECHLREIKRHDDGVSPIAEVRELVDYNCRGHYNNVKELLYTNYEVALGNAYLFVEKLRKSGSTKITEAIMAHRKMNQEEDPNITILRRQNIIKKKEIVPTPRVDPEAGYDDVYE